MSPRRTEVLHEIGDRQHLGTVVFVGFQRRDLGSEGLLVETTRRCLNQSGTNCLGPGHACGLELTESA